MILEDMPQNEAGIQSIVLTRIISRILMRVGKLFLLFSPMPNLTFGFSSLAATSLPAPQASSYRALSEKPPAPLRSFARLHAHRGRRHPRMSSPRRAVPLLQPRGVPQGRRRRRRRAQHAPRPHRRCMHLPAGKSTPFLARLRALQPSFTHLRLQGGGPPQRVSNVLVVARAA